MLSINSSSIEYQRQINSLRSNNLNQQKKANKQILIFASIAVLFFISSFVLNHFELINLS